VLRVGRGARLTGSPPPRRPNPPRSGRANPTLAPNPPLLLLLYAHTYDEAPATIVDRSGAPLPDGSGVVLPSMGSVLPWRDRRSACLSTPQGEGCDAVLAAGMRAQLRVLAGLDGTIPEALLSTWSRPSPPLPLTRASRPQSRRPGKPSASDSLHGLQGRREPEEAQEEEGLAAGVHWLEIEAISLACVHAHLAAAQADAAALRRILKSDLLRPGGRADDGAVRRLDASADAFARSSYELAARGKMRDACEVAMRASALARAAARHPTMLPVEEVPPDYWLTTWPPLFFPIATAVASALVSELRHETRER
jgi:hypothetical protein